MKVKNFESFDIWYKLCEGCPPQAENSGILLKISVIFVFFIRNLSKCKILGVLKVAPGGAQTLPGGAIIFPGGAEHPQAPPLNPPLQKTPK